MTADLSALIARLEAAEVGGRELDAAVYDQLFPRLKRDGKAVAGFPGRWPFHPGSAHDEEVTYVTTSLDAALALAERVRGEAHALNLLQDAMALNEADGLAIRDLPRLLCSFMLRAKQGEGE